MLRKPLKDSDVEYRWSTRTNFRHIRKKAEKNAAIKLSIKKTNLLHYVNYSQIFCEGL